MTVASLKIEDQVVKQLKQSGFVHITDMNENTLKQINDSLGEVIFTTDVIVKPESKSMVTSSRGLNLHTDHHKAKYIAWFCIKQSDTGGETILFDAEIAYSKLTELEKNELEKINLSEHKIFADDKEYYPLVSNSEGKRKFYFSYWLTNDKDKDNPALVRFKSFLEQATPIRISLKPNDILIIDNHRILHGRTPITGSKDRHLVRYWISENTFYKQLKTTRMAATALKFPDSITSDRISFLVSKGIDRDIASINLEMVKMKLKEPKEGIGWTEDQVEDAEIEYKRYLHLTRHFPFPKFSVVPNKIMDTMWHYHILDTKAYVSDCEKTFGHYLHHYPYFGLRGEEDEKNLKRQFENTKEYYLQTFGEELARNREADCWHDCEDRCWHACSDDKV